MRTFDSGATRDTDTEKLDYEGFFSPRVLRRYAEFMHKNRRQADGNLRASDNWQKGIPRDVYMKSLTRHFMEAWEAHRSGVVDEEALCAILFNTMGVLFEHLRPAPLPEEPFMVHEDGSRHPLSHHCPLCVGREVGAVILVQRP